MSLGLVREEIVAALVLTSCSIISALHPGNLVLLVIRNDDREIKAAKRSTLNMKEESGYEVQLYPEGSDKSAKPNP